MLEPEVEQIFSILKRLKKANATISIARHIELATRKESDLFYLTDRSFLQILEEYELEYTLDPIIDDDVEIERIVDEVANHFEELKNELLNNENNEI